MTKTKKFLKNTKQDVGFYFKMLFLLFAIAAIAGVVSVQTIPDIVSSEMESIVEDFSSHYENLNNEEMFALILANNAAKSFFAMLLGVFFGIVPVIFILLNGYVVGVIATIASETLGITGLFAGMLPHGVFEIPAVILAASYGIYIAEGLSRKYAKKRFLQYVKTALAGYFILVLPVLVLAALIEVYVTQYLVGAVVNLSF